MTKVAARKKWAAGARRWRKKHPGYAAPYQKSYSERNRRRILKTYRNRRLERKLALIALKGGKCTDCGFSGHHQALHFDHRDAATKLGELSELILLSWERSVTEVEKCDLVCANCHAIRTANRRMKQ